MSQDLDQNRSGHGKISGEGSGQYIGEPLRSRQKLQAPRLHSQNTHPRQPQLLHRGTQEAQNSQQTKTTNFLRGIQDG